jgi:hypothetical protein
MKALIAVMLVAGSVMAGELKETKRWIETNAWDRCVANYNEGLLQANVPPRIYAYTLAGANIICFTNDLYSGWGYSTKPCTKDHVADYPKISTEVKGVQWVVLYEDVVEQGGSKITNTYTRFLYPHEKRTVTTKVEMKPVTTTSNLVEKVTEPARCKTCGR